MIGLGIASTVVFLEAQLSRLRSRIEEVLRAASGRAHLFSISWFQVNTSSSLRCVQSSAFAEIENLKVVCAVERAS